MADNNPQLPVVNVDTLGIGAIVSSKHFLKGKVSLGGRFGPPLFLSDNAEQVTGGAQGTIFEYPDAARSGEHRVFLWHINNTTGAELIGVVINNTSNVAINATDIRGYVGTDGDYLRLGARNADGYLSGLDPIAPSSISVPPGAKAVIASWPWRNGAIVGGLMAFQIDPAAGYELWTVYGPSGSNLSTVDLTRGYPPVVTVDNKTHPRGSWTYSEVQVNCQGFSLLTPSNALLITPRIGRWYRLLVTSDTDVNIPFPAGESRNGKEQSVNNRAPYGAVLHVRVRIGNPCPTPQSVELYLQSWTGGDKYCGAVRGDMTGVVRQIPPLSSATDAADLAEIFGGAPLQIPGNGTQDFGFSLAVGGGSGSPCNLIALSM